MNDFEKSVRHALIDREMTMADLAEALEITPSYLHDILKDKRTATTQRERICEYLGIDDGVS